MDKEAKIFVAGHRGMVGSAIVRLLQARGYNNLLLKTHDELDLTSQECTASFMNRDKPHYIFMAAAKVGGIVANNSFPADFIYQNTIMEMNVIHSAWQAGVDRLLFLGSSCIYPRNCPQPIREEYFLTGSLEPTNEAYAVAKIAGIKMCESYNRQYGTGYVSVMPTNLYGPNDNYDLNSSHVLPALIRKAHDAKLRDDDVLEVWGTGTPRREFLYVDDLAEACVFLMEREDVRGGIFNIGMGKDITIADLAALVCQQVGFKGRLAFNSSKPDGMPRKLLDTSLMNSLGWVATTSLKDGIVRAYSDFLRCAVNKSVD